MTHADAVQEVDRQFQALLKDYQPTKSADGKTYKLIDRKTGVPFSDSDMVGGLAANAGLLANVPLHRQKKLLSEKFTAYLNGLDNTNISSSNNTSTSIKGTEDNKPAIGNGSGATAKGTKSALPENQKRLVQRAHDMLFPTLTSDKKEVPETPSLVDESNPHSWIKFPTSREEDAWDLPISKPTPNESHGDYEYVPEKEYKNTRNWLERVSSYDLFPRNIFINNTKYPDRRTVNGETQYLVHKKNPNLVSPVNIFKPGGKLIAKGGK